MANELVKYQTDHGEVQLSPEIIRKYLVPSGTTVSDQEIGLFLKLCEYQGLNPFLREVYLVKYGTNPAQMVTGKEVFTKRAQANPKFGGLQAGVTVINKAGAFTHREGSLVLDGEKLIGGWAKVYVKEFSVPFYEEVSMSEYSAGTALWKTKPATMIRKVAIVHALREAFPEMFEGLYSQEEINTIDASKLPTLPVDTSAEPIIVPVSDEDGVVYADAIVGYADEPSGTSTATDDVGSFVITFGKYNGKSLQEIATHEANVPYEKKYLVWLSQKGTDANVVAKVKAFLASQPTATIATPAEKKQAQTAKPIAQDEQYRFPDDNEVPLPFDI